ncbi:MAG: hypothetical protein GC179_27905 [Anaerolineaceae bacterium]|nr:hypothetical protein [Anaerolineaceae bacterium]
MAEDSGFSGYYSEGLNVFQNARRQAFIQEMMGLIRGQSAELLSFDDIKARLRLREESYKGLQNVPVDKIVGSVGRYRDFTSNFLPRGSTSRDRWSRVYAQVNSLQGTPPVELYKVGDVYFVRDGNHRVSVAKQLGNETIEAHVTELPTSIHIEPGMSIEDLDKAGSYAAFLEEIGLETTRPQHQSLELSEASRYSDLLGHIYLHKSMLEHKTGKPVTIEEAAASWYDNVFRPAVTLIRKYEILEHMPERTEADLFLWLIDHLREVRDELGDNAESRTFSDAVVDFLAERHIPVPKDLLMEKDESVILSKTQVMRAVQLGKAREAAKNGDDPTAE